MSLLGIRGTGTIIEDTRDVYFYTNKQIEALLALKEDKVPYGNTSQFWRGDKTWQVVPGGGGGGGSVDWTDITNKPSTFPPTLPINESDVTNLVLDLASKIGDAPIDGNQYARQDGAWSQVVSTGGGGSSDFAEVTGTITALQHGSLPGGDLHALASNTGGGDGFMSSADKGKLDSFNAAATYAPLASPLFTGNPTAPTPSLGDNDTSLATTEFVTRAITVSGGFPEAPTDG